MSKAKRSNVTPLPAPAAERPKLAMVGYPVRLELRTGGRFDVDGLLRELARLAFGPVLTEFSFQIIDGRPRCFVTCLQRSDFGPEQIEAANARVLRALLALEILKPASAVKPAAEPAQPEAPEKT